MKEQYTIEFDMRSVPVSILWNYISSPHGLEQWFADRVVQDGKHLSFYWRGAESDAVIVSMRPPYSIKLRWLDNEENNPGEKVFFEMKIEQSELTDTTTLAVTDFATAADKQESIDLWNHEIEELQRILGCL